MINDADLNVANLRLMYDIDRFIHVEESVCFLQLHDLLSSFNDTCGTVNFV